VFLVCCASASVVQAATLPSGFSETTIPGIGSPTAMEIAPPTMVRDPFPLANPFNFSSDNRTRVMLFVTNLDLAPGENSSAVTARVQDAAVNVFPLTVEFAGKVPGFDWLTQVIVRLPNNLPVGQPLFVTVTLHGLTSNKARIQIT
jgi:hypothetical protein